jgi:hypothetical protein
MVFKVKNKIIQYCPTPKCGCTSTKVMIRKGIEGVIDYEDDIHHKFNTKTFKVIDADIKFCIVRDPVDRFISSYTNRICRHEDIDFVGLDEFIEDFYDKYYRLDENIYHHFRPQVDFIGHDPSYYNRVFFLDEMPSVCELLSEVMGKPIKLEKLQTVEAEKPIPTEIQIDFIKSFYEDDYKFLEQIKR